MSSNPQPAFNEQTWQRAENALVCSPFTLALFRQMRSGSIPLAAMATESGKNQGYSQSILSENRVERELNWLIQVGLLRREVDGQGITDSFRLTPLGRELVEKWQEREDFPPVTSRDYLQNIYNRLLNFSI